MLIYKNNLHLVSRHNGMFLNQEKRLIGHGKKIIVRKNKSRYCKIMYSLFCFLMKYK